MIATVAYLTANPVTVAAHTPVAGAVQAYSAGITLTYHFYSSSYPTWVEDAYTNMLQSDYPALTYNNSKAPRFSQGSGGGILFYQTTSNGHCSNTYWLGCAYRAGQTNFEVYLRQKSGGYPTWCDVTLVDGCYDSRRVLIHEFEHIVLFVLNHDSQGESNTVMSVGPPTRPNTGWNTRHFQRCDLAAAQLLYDVFSLSGAYAKCFDHITGHGPTGLFSTATAPSTSWQLCINESVTASGRLAIKTTTDYGPLSNNPLAGRTLYFDRRPYGGSTWSNDVASTPVSSASGNNWSETFSSSVSADYQYRADYHGEVGVDQDYSDQIFRITWSTAC